MSISTNRLISTLEGCDIMLYTSGNKDELVKFIAKAAIDRDGSQDTHANEKGTPYYDPDFQPDTTLHIAGKPLDAYTVPFIVVPPIVCRKTANIVLGSLAWVQNSKTFDWCHAVVGDVGPALKIGELSPECARLIGLDPSPRHGGTDERIINYVIHVGIPARIAGIQYTLQKYGG
jgi:hypothetical protein